MKCARFIGAAVVLAWCGSARAQSDRELATRRDLITQAEDASSQGRHGDAVTFAKRAATIKMTPSLRLFLAREESAAGRLADAFGNARQCDAEAEANERLGARERILAECKAMAAALEKRVGRVTVRLPTPAPPDVRVTMSGEEVNAALVGAPYVVSPGKLSVVVSAPGYLPFASDVDVAEGGVAEVRVQLAPDPDAPCPAGEERVHGACAAACTNGKVRTADEAAQCCWPGQTWNASASACRGIPQCAGGLVARGEECVASAETRMGTGTSAGGSRSSGNRLVAPLVIGGAGVAGLVAGAVFGVMASSAWSTAKSECPTYTGCSAQAVSDHNNVVTFGTVSTVAFIAGGVLVAGGVTLYLVTPRDRAPAVGVHLAPGSVGVAGRF